MLITTPRSGEPLIAAANYIPPLTTPGKGNTSDKEQALKDAWGTPRWVLKVTSAIFLDGGMDCDPFYSPLGHTHEFMKPGPVQIYTGNGTDDDCGMMQPWEGFAIYVNGPFSMVKKWLMKCIETAQHPRRPEILAVTEFSESAKWFREQIIGSADLIVALGRVGFVSPVGSDISRPRASHCLIGWNTKGFHHPGDTVVPLGDIVDMQGEPTALANRKIWVVRNRFASNAEKVAA